MKNTNRFFIIDFDSTFITTEGLEELAMTSLAKNPHKEEIYSKITNLTNKAMAGEMSFKESLENRLNLLTMNRAHIEATVKRLQKQISPSIERNKKFFQDNSDQIFIISSGFKELIIPIVTPFGISENHVFANTFIFDNAGNIIGCDTSNPLSQDNGKVTQIRKIHLTGEIFMIGDGYTDYQVKEAGLATTFVAFIENIQRENVMSKADKIASSFDELITYITPRTFSYPKEKLSVLLLENINQTAVTAFEKEGYLVRHLDKSLSEEELIKAIETTSLLCIRSRTQINPYVLEKARRLLAIGVFAIGVNQVDLAAASQKGVAVFNAPFSNTRSVVELVIGEIIMLMRNVFEKSTKLHDGVWDKSAHGSYEVRGKTLGIIGYGNIGTQVGILAEALGMNVCFFDKEEKLHLGNAQQCATMEELLNRSDVITVHVDGDANNKALIGQHAFTHMKDGVLFINASRGFVVDEEALLTHLKSGKVKAAALDVFASEPKSNTEPFSSALQQFPQVILTPHIGGSTTEAQTNIAQFVSQKLIEFVNTGSTSLSVNLPAIQLPQQINSHRLLHLHKNVPGVLAQINTLFAQYKSNIVGQYLKTDAHVGYVITDVDSPYDKTLLEKLKQIPETIRFRVLY